MKFSIITPTHSKDNLAYLVELWQSIRGQTYPMWEWVLLLNNGLCTNDIPSEIRSHSQVKVMELQQKNNSIGYIKNVGFMLASGDILVEVDHDDILAVDCLSELEKAFEDPEIGFVYSSSITYDMKNDFIPYNPRIGWTYKQFEYQGRKRYCMTPFEPSSHAMSFIWYAPDHVRAWRASVYKELGGHNIELEVCDDHELLIRTYLYTKMKLINKPLYVYRITGDNTWLNKNALIQETTKVLFQQYVKDLAIRDAGLKSLSVIKVRDIETLKTLKNNSVGVLETEGLLEHCFDKMEVMNEVYRVLAHGGWFFGEVPSTDGRGAFQDPVAKSYWNENSFMYWTKQEHAAYINSSCKFIEYHLENYYPNSFCEEHNILMTKVILAAYKDGPRFPGYLDFTNV